MSRREAIRYDERTNSLARHQVLLYDGRKHGLSASVRRVLF